MLGGIKMTDSKLPTSVKNIYAYIRRSRQDMDRERKKDQDTLAEQHSLLEGILDERYNHFDWDMYEEVESGADAMDERPVFKNIISELENAHTKSSYILLQYNIRSVRCFY